MKKDEVLTYIEKTLDGLKIHLKYYQGTRNGLVDEIDLLPDEEEWDDLDDLEELLEIKSDLTTRMADVDSSIYWIEDQIDTLEKILEL